MSYYPHFDALATEVYKVRHAFITKNGLHYLPKIEVFISSNFHEEILNELNTIGGVSGLAYEYFTKTEIYNFKAYIVEEGGHTPPNFRVIVLNP